MTRTNDLGRPTGYHWGTYPSTAQLPNVAGSSTQTDQVDKGDIATILGTLYRCTLHTPGAATWEKIPTLADVGGDVVGPSSATDNVVVRFDATTGKLIQESAANIDDDGKLTLTGAAATLVIDASSGSETAQMFTGTGYLDVYITEDVGDELQLRIDASGPDGRPQMYPVEDSTYDFGAESFRWLTGKFDNVDATTLVHCDTQYTLASQLNITTAKITFAPVTGASPAASSLYAQGGATVGAGVNGITGANFTIAGGDGSAGGTGETTDGAGGDFIADGGASGGSANAGSVNLGVTNAYAVNIGRAAGRIGFHGATAVAKQTVTGSTGANAALQNLLTALEALGLITDSTT